MSPDRRSTWVLAPTGTGCLDDRVSGSPGDAANGATHADEPHAGGLGGKLNWLRAGVLGANDGIVSVAGLVVGVAGATAERAPIFTAGLAGLVAGAVSMALGEYISVSSQRDTEMALLAKEKQELQEDPESELAELAGALPGEGPQRRDRRDRRP